MRAVRFVPVLLLMALQACQPRPVEPGDDHQDGGSASSPAEQMVGEGGSPVDGVPDRETTADSTATEQAEDGLLERPGVDPALPVYEPVEGVAGLMTSVGSDTMSNLMTLWAMGFRALYPDVQIQVSGAGSATGPAALASGTASFAPMSRSMSEDEMATFVARHGYEPSIVCGAIDALAVYVHRDNPIERLTIPEVDAIFSSTRGCGLEHPIRSWSQLGLAGDLGELDIVTQSRNQLSGTHEYFRVHALCDGEYAEHVVFQDSSARVVVEVGSSIDTIGFSGLGYSTSSVRAVPLASDEGAPAIEATAENAASRLYPLGRFLCVYMNRHPEGGLPLAEREFLRFILSRQGQELVAREGFVPLPAHLVERQRRELGLD